MRAIVILLSIVFLTACRQRQTDDNKHVAGDTTNHKNVKFTPLFVCVYNGDTIVQRVPQGYLYIERKGEIPSETFTVADDVELEAVALDWHSCNSDCIYYDSITAITTPGLQKLVGQPIATLYTNEGRFRDEVTEAISVTGKGVARKAKGKIIHTVITGDRYDHWGLLFIEK